MEGAAAAGAEPPAEGAQETSAVNETNVVIESNVNNASNAVRKRGKIQKTIERAATFSETKLEKEAHSVVDVFIKAKLKEWDKDRSGVFSPEEVEAAMVELRARMAQLASLKWQVIIGSLVIACGLTLVLGAAAVALTLMKSTEVSSHGAMMKKGSNARIVTSEASGVGDIPSVLSYDEGSDAWSVDDAALRQIDAVSFTAGNGTFYHLKVAELARFDSGPSGSTDQLNILTDTGHRLKITEVDDFRSLEVQWKGTSLWVQMDTEQPGRRLELEDPPAGDPGPDPDSPGALAAPRRLVGKGHYVGGVYVHSRGGHYRCDPAYVDGYHDPDYYCDDAVRTGSQPAFFLWAALALWGAGWRALA